MPKSIISLPHELIIKILRYNGDYILFGKQHQLLDIKYLLRIPKIGWSPGKDLGLTFTNNNIFFDSINHQFMLETLVCYGVRLPITNNKRYYLMFLSCLITRYQPFLFFLQCLCENGVFEIQHEISVYYYYEKKTNE